MPKVTNAFTTYNAVGNREDLSNRKISGIYRGWHSSIGAVVKWDAYAKELENSFSE